MEKMLNTLGMQGMAAMVVVLAVVAVILGLVCIMLSLQINKMLDDAQKTESKCNYKVRTIQETLADCKAQMRELERQKEEAEQAAENYKAQRDFLINSRKSGENAEKPDEDPPVD